MDGEKRSERSEESGTHPERGSTDRQEPSGGQQGDAHEKPPLPPAPSPLEIWPNLGCLLGMIAGALMLVVFRLGGADSIAYYLIF